MNQDKRKLKNTINTHFNTAIIGMVASVEDHFGKFWGHPKKEEEIISELTSLQQVLATMDNQPDWTDEDQVKFDKLEKKEIELERQLKVRAIWAKVREEMMDKGNDQKRMALSNIDRHQIKWDGRYHYEFRTEHGRGDHQWKFKQEQQHQRKGNRK